MSREIIGNLRTILNDEKIKGIFAEVNEDNLPDESREALTNLSCLATSLEEDQEKEVSEEDGNAV